MKTPTSLALLPLFLGPLACANAPVRSLPEVALSEIPVVGGGTLGAGSPLRVGTVATRTPQPVDVDLGRTCIDSEADGLRAEDFRVALHEDDGTAWRATCRHYGFMVVERLRDPARALEPTAVSCTLDGFGGEARFRFELTRGKTDNGVGSYAMPGETVVIERGVLHPDPTLVPVGFVVRHQGIAIAWLQTRPDPHLLVLRDLDAHRTRLAERAAALVLLFDAGAARHFHGLALCPAPWSLAHSPEQAQR